MNTAPKILLFDIETAPNLAYVWGKYEQDVISLERSWYMLCFAAKWADQKQTFAYGLPDFPLYKKEKANDRELVRKLWELFDEADIIIAHNGDQFDIKKTNARFIEHGFTPPAPYKTIDTKKVAKASFKFDSNKLDDLGQYLKLGRKLKTGGFDLWLGCMSGDKKAWQTMIDYNKQDVILLEKVYLAMRPWMKNHPNMNVYKETGGLCPNCSSSNIGKRGFSYSTNGKVQVYVCKDCGSRPSEKSLKLKNLKM
jgi:DNA polymerase elongation subunit (family B)